MPDILRSEHGSVMLEFCLVLPIYLLIFGGTFLLFDISMARLHLQEANRNIAWIQNDRYDSRKLIDGELYRRSLDHYETRNALETKFSGEPMWNFGDLYAKYEEKRKEAKENNQNFAEEPPWGVRLYEFKENGVELNIDQSWANNLGGLLEDRLTNKFLMLRSGNMELSLKKISAVYLGAIGVSTVVLDPEETSVPLYRQQYALTRARTEKGETHEEKAASTVTNGEALIVRRTADGEKRENARDVNDLSPLSLDSKTPDILFGSWPSNGKLGDISVFLGVGL